MSDRLRSACGSERNRRTDEENVRNGRADEHRRSHEYYRIDDNAADRAVTLHRRKNPAADHAAEAVVIYDLQRRVTENPSAESRLAP